MGGKDRLMRQRGALGWIGLAVAACLLVGAIVYLSTPRTATVTAELRLIGEDGPPRGEDVQAAAERLRSPELLAEAESRSAPVCLLR